MIPDINQSPKPTIQFHTITSLRGIAALMIVLHHFTSYFLPEIGKYAITYTPFFPKNYLWVDFFFILSGFILFHVYGEQFMDNVSSVSYWRYLLARFARIYPLHVFFLVLFIGMECVELLRYHYMDPGSLLEAELRYQPFTNKQSVLSIFTNLGMVHAFHSWSYWNEPAWALGAEWLIYLFVPFLLPLAHRTNTFLDIAGTLWAIFILWLMINRYGGDLDWVTWKSLVRCFCECTIGIALYKMHNRGYWSRVFSWKYASALLLILCFLTLMVPINHIFTIIMFSFLILAAAAAKDNDILNNSLLRYLGTISYSIYMSHWLIQEGIKNGSRWFTHREFSEHFNFIQMPIVLFLLVILVIGGSHLTYLWVEKPLRKKLRGLYPSKPISG